MKASEIINRLFGYDEISIESASPEDFLNAAAKNDAEIWHIRRPDPATMTARTRVFDRKKIWKIAGECKNLSLTFLQSRGLPPLLGRYRLRYGLLCGALLAAVTVWIMSGFVWSVQVTGNSAIPEEEITAFLEENGLFSGALSSRQDIGQIKNKMLLSFPNLAHVSLNIRGSLATVEITERVMPPAVASTEACNVVASQDGQIVLAEAYEGVPYVKVGDSVKKGQLLVGGIFDSKVVGYRTVHASAKILARTRRSLSVQGDYAYTQVTPTGREKQRYSLILFGKEIPLYISDRPFEKWNEVSSETALSFGDAVLALSLKKTVCREIREEPKEYTAEQLTAKLEEQIREKERIALCGLTVEDKRKNVTETKTGITVETLYTIIEEIGQQQPILRAGEQQPAEPEGKTER